MAINITQVGSLTFGEAASFQVKSSSSLYIQWAITFNGRRYEYTSYENDYISFSIPWVYNVSFLQFSVTASAEDINNGGTSIATKTYTAYPPDPTSISVSPDPVKFGEELTITKEYSSPNFTHALCYSLDGSTLNTITTEGGYHNSSYSWTVPTSLASSITSGDSMTLYIICITYNGSAMVGRYRTTVTVKLGSGTIPVLSAPSVYLGNVLTISLPRASTSFTHDLESKIMHGSGGGYATGVIATGVATTYSWTVPLSLAFQRPSDKSFTIQLICKTYNGSSLIDTQTVEFTAIVPENSTTKPSIGTVECAPVSDVLPASIANACFVEQKSKLQALISASGYGTTIASYSMSISGTTVSSISNVLVSPVLTVSGDVTVTVKVTDARGFTNTKNVTIQVVPYTKPRVSPASGQSVVIAARWNAASGVFDDAGLAVKILCARQYSPVISGSKQYNFCTMKVRYMQADASGYGAWQTLLEGANMATDQVDKVLSSVEFDATKEYLLQICVEDTVGEDTILTLRIPAVGCTLHLGSGGMSVGIGQFAADEPHRIDMAWKTHLHKGIEPRQIYSGSVVEVGAEFEGADVTAVSDYTLFWIHMLWYTNYPMLAVRNDDKIYGSYGGKTVVIQINQDSLTVLSNETSEKPCGIYALL